jgi:hypothetical protein
LPDRTRNIIATPTTEWPVIAVEEAIVSALYRRYILPFAAIPVIASLIGRMASGDQLREWAPDFHLSAKAFFLRLTAMV